MALRIFKQIGFGAGAIALFGFAFGVDPLSAQTKPSGTVTRATLAVKDPKASQRSYIVYTPHNVKPGAPLLFVFHGSGGDGESMRDVTSYEFDMLADKNGFLVIYPDGYQRTWNDCRKGSPQPARVVNIDDDSFIEAMIATEVDAHAIDAKRVFAMRWSNAARLNYRLATEGAKDF